MITNDTNILLLHGWKCYDLPKILVFDVILVSEGLFSNAT